MKPLNSRQIKKLNKEITGLYNLKKNNLLKSYSIFENNKGKIYITTKEINKLNLKLNSIGIYFAKRHPRLNLITLSIEGSQLLGKFSRNILELNKKQIEEWIKANNIEIKKPDNIYTVSYKNNFFGTGIINNNILKNFIGKDRKLKEILFL